MRGYLGILTGGGDCPGLNAAIRAIVRRAHAAQIPLLGIHDGWQGLMDGNIEPLTRFSVAGIQYKGGTILGTSRTNPLTDAAALQKIRHHWNEYELGAVIVIGGNGTLSCSTELWRKEGYPLVGIPKTIDNDIPGTDTTIGFDTAVSIATEAIDRLHTTAEAQHRVMVVEVMGRHSGWIATHAGIAGGADLILVPEIPFRISEVVAVLTNRRDTGRPFSIIVVAEDARPHSDEDFTTEDQRRSVYQEDRLGGIGQLVAQQIEERTRLATRVTTLGYVQRGGVPTAYDRVIATRFGVYAVEMILREEYGRMAALRGTEIISVPLDEIKDRFKTINRDIYQAAEVFFG